MTRSALDALLIRRASTGLSDLSRMLSIMRQAEPVERGPGGAAPSLVLDSESVPEIVLDLPGEICPKRPYWVEALEDPTLRFPASCDAYRCHTCGPRKALEAAAVMTWAMSRADRSRLITATLAPEDWQQRRKKVRRFRQEVVKRGYPWEMGWTTERGSETGMVHIHGVQHGAAKVPQALLQEIWGAIVDIRAVKPGNGAARYVTKEALRVAGYVIKGGTASASGLDDHLDLNGGRVAHWSRGFLHGLTKREALAEHRRSLADGVELTWRLVPAWRGSGQETTSPA